MNVVRLGVGVAYDCGFTKTWPHQPSKTLIFVYEPLFHRDFRIIEFQEIDFLNQEYEF